MTSDDVKFAISVGMPSLLVLVGILVNNSRLSDLRHLMDKRFDSVDKRFDDVTRVIEARSQDTSPIPHLSSEFYAQLRTASFENAGTG